MSDQFGRAFCVLPWLHSFINIGGEYQVCCTSEEFHDGILDNSGNIFNIKNQPNLKHVMNSDFMKNLRLSMLDGELPELCTRCIVTEKMAGTSRRMIENMKFEQLVPSLLETTDRDGTIPLDIRSADFRLGNICNLECRMCNPRSSIMWNKDWNKFKNPKDHISPELEDEYSSYDWINDDYLLTELKQKLGKLKILHFAGGEPLIAPRMAEMLQLCIDYKVADKMSLTYNTNVYKLPEKVLNLWKHFKEVHLYCSIDGFGKVNEYIRVPSKWEVIDKNLRFLDEHADEYNIKEILFSVTVQAYNILNLDDLIRYTQTFKRATRAPSFVNLFSPHYMMTQVLPPHIKKLAAERLQAAKQGLDEILPRHLHYLIENIDQAINYMNAKDLHPELWNEFIDFNLKMDESKGLKMEDCIPELAQATKLRV